LRQAVAGCHLVFGLSARPRNIAWPSLEARDCGALAVAEAAAGEVAIVFGCEHSGLSNAELDHCHYLVHIPSNPEYRSLNLAAAVQVMAYEVRVAFLTSLTSLANVPSDAPLASTDKVEGFFAHLEQALVEIGFLDPDNPRLLMRRLRRLFLRARLDSQEINILRGILTAAQSKARKLRKIQEAG
jgi:tRNA (cytidine32/uridine32-2'-O)-methyltransferase